MLQWPIAPEAQGTNVGLRVFVFGRIQEATLTAVVPGLGAGPTQVLKDLRVARRRQRITVVDPFDVVYKVYVTGIVLSLAVVLLAGLTGDQRLGASGLHAVRLHGAQAVGLGVAVIMAIGVRSGARGGPLVVEAAEVRHVLLAPIERKLALRGPVVRQLRFGALVGAGAGAIAGLLAHQRLPGSSLVWIACGALGASATTVAALGVALIASGLRVGRVWGGAVCLALLVWSGFDIYAGVTTSPMTLLGQVGLWATFFRPLGLLGLGFAVLVVLIGSALVGGCSLEGAERRSSLVGQIRFAATLQDLRTVVVLRRQLAQDQPRQRPWIKLSPAHQTGRIGSGRAGSGQGGRSGRASKRGELRYSAGFATWRRGWHGLLRFSATRVTRLFILGVVAGLSALEVWSGTTSLVLVTGLVLYLVGLDAVEPMAQEIDHPDRQDQYPMVPGWIHLRSLAAPAVLVVMVGLVGVAAATVATGLNLMALEVGAILVVPASLAGLGGAALSVVNGPPPPLSTQAMISPEFSGIRVVLRLLLPPLVAVLGVLPLVAARHADKPHMHPLVSAAAGIIPVLALVSVAVGWVRNHREIKDWWTAQMEQAKQPRDQLRTPRPDAA